MKEIERKYRLPKSLRKHVLHKIGLTEAVVRQGSKVQRDEVFLYQKDTYKTYVFGEYVARLRRHGTGKTLEGVFTLKRRISETTSDEFEFTASSYAAARAMLLALEWQPVVRITKKRIGTRYKGVHVTVDRVERLGDFIELEIVAKKHTTEAEEKLKRVARELCLDEALWINTRRGYDYMIAELDGKV